MTRQWTRWFGLSAIVLVVAASAALAEDKLDSKALRERLQGEWSFTTAEGNPGKFTFDGEKVTAEVDGQTYVARITTNPRNEPHPAIDFSISEGPGDSVGQTLLGILKFDSARKVALCIALPNQPRPTELKADGDGVMLLELSKKD